MSCLCRTLLAFVAVSCTLSRIHAHGQAPQRLDRIKDLMCVFLLSGMQKEDLDVNMLTKLQRHNVNIGDMSNRELLQKCMGVKRNEYMQNNTLETNTTTTTTTTTATTTTTTTVKAEIIDMLSNKTLDKTATNDKKESTNTGIIDYVDGQPDIQSVLNFWQNINVNKSNITPHFHEETEHFTDTSQTRSEQKNKRNIQEDSNDKEANIKKLITKYILRDVNNNTLKTTTIKTNIDVENEMKESYFQEIFRNYNNQHFIENNHSHDNSPANSPLRLFEQYTDMRRKQEESTTTPALTTEKFKNNTNFNDMMNFLNTYKTYYPDITKNKNKESINGAQEVNINRNIVTEKTFTASDNIVNENIPQNLIKEIAISVKDMVLNELRKELKSTTTTVETTTTIATFTTSDITVIPTPKINQNIEEVILSKFLDLFNEIKSLKQSKIVLSDKSEIDTKIARIELKKENTQIQRPIGEENDMEPIKQNLNNYKNKKPLTYNFSPQVHKLRMFNKPKPVQQIPKPKQLITIQTNNMEIPPLGIPIDMPENPINQNIVVTTAQYRIGPHKADLRNIKREPSMGFDDYKPKEKYVAKPFVDPYYSKFDETYKGVQLPNNNYNNGQRNVEHSNNKMHVKRYQQFDDRLISKVPVSRYHEKLENVDTYVDPAVHKNRNNGQIDCCDEKYAYLQQMVDCCNSNIAARQQMSINNVKKQGMYDTHYNNYVKSQKKVTDMLEKILASKNSNRIQAPGVEIA